MWYVHCLEVDEGPNNADLTHSKPRDDKLRLVHHVERADVTWSQTLLIQVMGHLVGLSLDVEESQAPVIVDTVNGCFVRPFGGSILVNVCESALSLWISILACKKDRNHLMSCVLLA